MKRARAALATPILALTTTEVPVMAEPNRKLPAFRPQDIRRFNEKVDRASDNECWLWLSATLRGGYGVFQIAGRTVKAHRVAYLLHTGEDPVGFLVCHRCDNRKCCNPNHLFKGSSLDNNADRDRKGRTSHGPNHMGHVPAENLPRGITHGMSKMNDDIVRRIRHEYASGNISQVVLSAKYGLHQTQISKIIRRLTWRHVA
jgi:hypothetical protein